MSEELTERQQQSLLHLARRAIERYLDAGTMEKPSPEDVIGLEKRGVFVTLKTDGELRGCIGHPLPVLPLASAVVELAVAAASRDFRFEPLRPEEMKRTRIEISVLGLPKPVDNPQDVVVGKHGIIISKGFHKGLLLPQVPLEYGWDRETYLRHGCLKAGLGPEDWKKGARIEVFTAQVFGEKEEA